MENFPHLLTNVAYKYCFEMLETEKYLLSGFYFIRPQIKLINSVIIFQLIFFIGICKSIDGIIIQVYLFLI